MPGTFPEIARLKRPYKILIKVLFVAHAIVTQTTYSIPVTFIQSKDVAYYPFMSIYTR